MTISEAALNHFKKVMADNSIAETVNVRLVAMATCCGSVTFGMDFDEVYTETEDQLMVHDGVRFVTKNAYSPIFENASIDYDAEKEGFVFDANITSPGGCGCTNKTCGA